MLVLRLPLSGIAVLMLRLPVPGGPTVGRCQLTRPDPGRRTAGTCLVAARAGPSTGCLIILISKGVAAAIPGRALVLGDKELGEAAQAPERSGFHGSKRKAQVGGDL